MKPGLHTITLHVLPKFVDVIKDAGIETTFNKDLEIVMHSESVKSVDVESRTEGYSEEIVITMEIDTLLGLFLRDWFKNNVSGKYAITSINSEND